MMTAPSWTGEDFRKIASRISRETMPSRGTPPVSKLWSRSCLESTISAPHRVAARAKAASATAARSVFHGGASNPPTERVEVGQGTPDFGIVNQNQQQDRGDGSQMQNPRRHNQFQPPCQRSTHQQGSNADQEAKYPRLLRPVQKPVNDDRKDNEVHSTLPVKWKLLQHGQFGDSENSVRVIAISGQRSAAGL